MKVPLKIEVHSNNLNYIYNKEEHFESFKILPSFYIENDTEIVGAETTLLEKTLLHKNTKQYVYKKSFPSLKMYFDARKEHFDKIIYSENYINQLYIENLPFEIECNEPEPMFFDIECETTGTKLFPVAEKVPIILISTQFKGEKKIFSTYEQSEKEMLLEFLTYIKTQDPDILCGYNIIKFDLPYIITRCKINYIVCTHFLNRGTSGKVDVNLDYLSFYGRVIYDLYQQCSADNKLRKLKNLKLNTVAEHFNLGNKVEIDFIGDLNSTRTNQERKELFLKYSTVDTELCEKIYNIYFVSKYHLAHMLNVSLNDAMNAYPSFIPNLFHARTLYHNEYLPYKTNLESHQIFKEQSEKKSKLFQGAHVDIYKSGLFKTITHIDYSSMYPNLMITYNVSPENIELLEIKDYNDEFTFTNDKKFIYIEFPDSVLKKNLVVKLSKKLGLVTKVLQDCYTQRLIYKKKAKKSGLTQDVSIENIFKLQLNSAYGYNGATFAKWGSLLGAALITALGRWLILETIKLVKDTAIEVDTDGIYLDSDADLTKINATIKDLVLKTGVNENFLVLDKTQYDGGFFSKAKNYILRKNDKYLYSGSNFTSRRLCPLARNMQNDIIHGLFTDQNLAKIYTKYYAFENRPVSDFVMNIRVKKDLREYKAKNALGLVLAKQVKEAFGASEFNQIEYVATTGQYKYMPSKLVKFININLLYYTNELNKILDRFDISKNTNLDKWIK